MRNSGNLILNIETSSIYSSVCLSKETKVLSHKIEREEFQHARVLTTLIDQVLKDASCDIKDIDAVSISKGPGSFTALRVGFSVAKGICLATGAKLIGIETMKILASAGKQEVKKLNKEYLIVPLIDARRMEVYTAVYHESLRRATEMRAEIIDLDFRRLMGLTEHQGKIIYVGNGVEKSKPILDDGNSYFVDLEPDAIHMPLLSDLGFRESQFEDLAYFEPFYLKSPHITTPKNKLLH